MVGAVAERRRCEDILLQEQARQPSDITYRLEKMVGTGAREKSVWTRSLHGQEMQPNDKTYRLKTWLAPVDGTMV